jgi:hypothetical protein
MRNVDGVFFDLITQVVMLTWTDFIGPKGLGNICICMFESQIFYLCQSLAFPNLLLIAVCEVTKIKVDIDTSLSNISSSQLMD